MTKGFEYKQFKEKFWEWFDSIPEDERKMFQSFKADMAETFFYNKFYKHQESKYDESGNANKDILE